MAVWLNDRGSIALPDSLTTSLFYRTILQKVNQPGTEGCCGEERLTPLDQRMPALGGLEDFGSGGSALGRRGIIVTSP